MTDDLGGIFASDTHRRTLAHLPVPKDDPTTAEDLLDRMRPDAFTDFTDLTDLGEVLSDLEADGHAGNTKAGWKQTKKGHDALSGPNAEESEA